MNYTCTLLLCSIPGITRDDLYCVCGYILRMYQVYILLYCTCMQLYIHTYTCTYMQVWSGIKRGFRAPFGRVIHAITWAPNKIQCTSSSWSHWRAKYVTDLRCTHTMCNGVTVFLRQKQWSEERGNKFSVTGENVTYMHTWYVWWVCVYIWVHMVWLTHMYVSTWTMLSHWPFPT